MQRLLDSMRPKTGVVVPLLYDPSVSSISKPSHPGHFMGSIGNIDESKSPSKALTSQKFERLFKYLLELWSIYSIDSSVSIEISPIPENVTSVFKLTELNAVQLGQLHALNNSLYINLFWSKGRGKLSVDIRKTYSKSIQNQTIFVRDVTFNDIIDINNPPVEMRKLGELYIHILRKLALKDKKITIFGEPSDLLFEKYYRDEKIPYAHSVYIYADNLRESYGTLLIDHLRVPEENLQIAVYPPNKTGQTRRRINIDLKKKRESKNTPDIYNDTQKAWQEKIKGGSRTKKRTSVKKV